MLLQMCGNTVDDACACVCVVVCFCAFLRITVEQENDGERRSISTTLSSSLRIEIKDPKSQFPSAVKAREAKRIN